MKDTNKCAIHKKQREVMCTACKHFFCAKCIVEHLHSAHKVSLLAHLDTAASLYQDQLKRHTEDLAKAKGALEDQCTMLRRASDCLGDSEALDAVMREAVKKVEQEIAFAKERNKVVQEEINALVSRLSDAKTCYEKKYAKHYKALEALKAGGNSPVLDSEDIERLANEMPDETLNELVKDVKKVVSETEGPPLNLEGYVRQAKSATVVYIQSLFSKIIGEAAKEAGVNIVSAKENARLDLKGYNDMEEEKLNLKDNVIKSYPSNKIMYESQIKELEKGLEKCLTEQKLLQSRLKKKQRALEELTKSSSENNIAGSSTHKSTAVDGSDHNLLELSLRMKSMNEVRTNSSKPSSVETACACCKKALPIKQTHVCVHCLARACNNCVSICKECYDFACKQCAGNCGRTSLIQLDKYTQYIYFSSEQLGGMKELCGFDLFSKKVVNFHIEIPWENRIIQLAGRVFITGGYKNGNSLSDVSEFFESTKTLISRASMNNPRHTHSLVRVRKNSFAAIGGYTYGQMRECEQYDITENAWRQLPPLNEAKQLTGCLMIQDKILYCFGGKKADGACKTLEELVLGQPQWRIVELVENQAIDGWCPALYQVSRTEIIIFRGRNMTDVYLFDTISKKIKKYEKLVPIPEVYTNQLYKIGDTVYTVGYYANLHVFDTKKMEYEAIRYEDIK
eukprot:TRINITY_DN9275_c0_g1_i11.p1 TRINITY_DN9275_c0_g1~~TRINITY_DN9275_c0_g1_i11.p1  ORF type:complete len:680 (+),score=171.51 TRINITY_DN9275_c0_g1_i11:175-2214(+)